MAPAGPRWHRGRVAPGELLLDAVEREVLAGHEGKSGAGLERVRLADGRALVVKRVHHRDRPHAGRHRRHGRLGVPSLALRCPGPAARRTSGTRSWTTWVEGETTVVAMRDLGDDVLTWERHLDATECLWMLTRVAALHRAFLDDPPTGLVPLDRVLALFAPSRSPRRGTRTTTWCRSRCGAGRCSRTSRRADVAGPVLRLLADIGPLVPPSRRGRAPSSTVTSPR